MEVGYMVVLVYDNDNVYGEVFPYDTSDEQDCKKMDMFREINCDWFEIVYDGEGREIALSFLEINNRQIKNLTEFLFDGF